MILFCSIDRNNKTCVDEEEIVKVFSPLYKRFYRAKVLNIFCAKFHVFYIDFGQTEFVQLCDIFELSNSLKKKVSYIYHKIRFNNIRTLIQLIKNNYFSLDLQLKLELMCHIL